MQSHINEQPHINEQQWLEFLDGEMDTAAQELAKLHLDACGECSRMHSELAAWREALASTGTRFRNSFALSEVEAGRMLAESLNRIRAAPAWNAAEGLLLLNFLLAPICGAGTARAAIAVARKRSAAEGTVTGANWRLFVANLSEAIASVAGMAAGRLVDQAGVLLQIEGA